jgi:hypothetical protein
MISMAMSEQDVDSLIRMAAFDHVRQLVEVCGRLIAAEQSITGNYQTQPPDYETGGQEFESLRARHFLLKIQQTGTGTQRPFP